MPELTPDREAEDREWIKDFRDGQFEPAYYVKRWPVEMDGVVDAWEASLAEIDCLRAEVEQNQGACAVLAKNLVEAGAEVERLTGLLLRVENEELNGRLCPMPDFENEEAGCPKCRKLWADIRAALRQHEERLTAHDEMKEER